MKRSALFITGLAVVCLSLLPASNAKAASDVHRFSFRQAVQAFWDFPEADGGFTLIFVSADAQPAPGSTSRNVFIEVFRYSSGADPEDPSDDVFRSIAGLEELGAGELVLSGKGLDWATLQVSIPAEDCTSSTPPGPEPPVPGSCTETTISADLVWTATGPVESHRGSFHDRCEGGIANGQFSFTGRQAEVEGSVTVGSTNQTHEETGSGILIARSSDQSVFIGNSCFEFPA